MINVRLFAVAGLEVLRADSHSRRLSSSLPRAVSPAGRDDLATAARRHTRKSTCHNILVFWWTLKLFVFSGICEKHCRKIFRRWHTRSIAEFEFVCYFLVIREKPRFHLGIRLVSLVLRSRKTNDSDSGDLCRSAVAGPPGRGARNSRAIGGQ